MNYGSEVDWCDPDGWLLAGWLAKLASWQQPLLALPNSTLSSQPTRLMAPMQECETLRKISLAH